MKKHTPTILSLFALLISISCTSDEKIMSVGQRIEQIIAESDNPPEGGTPTLESLVQSGIQNAGGSQTAYEKAIATARPAPKTLTEMQNIINNVNDNVVINVWFADRVFQIVRMIFTFSFDSQAHRKTTHATAHQYQHLLYVYACKN